MSTWARIWYGVEGLRIREAARLAQAAAARARSAPETPRATAPSVSARPSPESQHAAGMAQFFLAEYAQATSPLATAGTSSVPYYAVAASGLSGGTARSSTVTDARVSGTFADLGIGTPVVQAPQIVGYHATLNPAPALAADSAPAAGGAGRADSAVAATAQQVAGETAAPEATAPTRTEARAEPPPASQQPQREQPQQQLQQQPQQQPPPQQPQHHRQDEQQQQQQRQYRWDRSDYYETGRGPSRIGLYAAAASLGLAAFALHRAQHAREADDAYAKIERSRLVVALTEKLRPEHLEVLEEFKRRAQALTDGRHDNFALVFVQALTSDRHPLHALAVQADQVRRHWLASVQEMLALRETGALGTLEAEAVKRTLFRPFYAYVRPLDEAVHRLVLRDGWNSQHSNGAAEFHRRLLYDERAYQLVALEDVSRIERWSKQLQEEEARPARRRWWFW